MKKPSAFAHSQFDPQTAPPGTGGRPFAGGGFLTVPPFAFFAARKFAKKSRLKERRGFNAPGWSREKPATNPANENSRPSRRSEMGQGQRKKHNRPAFQLVRPRGKKASSANLEKKVSIGPRSPRLDENFFWGGRPSPASPLGGEEIVQPAGKPRGQSASRRTTVRPPPRARSPPRPAPMKHVAGLACPAARTQWKGCPGVTRASRLKSERAWGIYPPRPFSNKRFHFFSGEKSPPGGGGEKAYPRPIRKSIQAERDPERKLEDRPVAPQAGSPGGRPLTTAGQV